MKNIKDILKYRIEEMNRKKEVVTKQMENNLDYIEERNNQKVERIQTRLKARGASDEEINNIIQEYAEEKEKMKEEVRTMMRERLDELNKIKKDLIKQFDELSDEKNQ